MKKIKEDFYNHKQVSKRDVKCKNDSVILNLSMVYDLNFECSFEYLKQHKLIDKMFDNIEDKEIFKEYFEYIKNYIEERTR